MDDQPRSSGLPGRPASGERDGPMSAVDPGHEGPTRQAGIELNADPVSVRLARDFVTGVLFAWELEDQDQVAELLTSEIVTNAVRCSRGRVRVEASVSPNGSLRVGASDDHPGVPSVRQPNPLAPGGRGTVLVRSLARRWGVRAESGHKVVWFETQVARRRARR
jgi:anti-sigma regulatory factor (Ser/Thr protein kinase)